MEDRILTLHPEGKQGVNISKDKYNVVKDAIIASLTSNPKMSFRGLEAEVGKRIKNGFEGSIGWYYTTVKLDLEARGIIKRIPKTQPQQISLA